MALYPPTQNWEQSKKGKTMIEKLVIQKLTIAGKKYEYPDTTALVGKINEIINELNHILEERESGIKVYEEAQDMYDNAILDALKDKQVDVVVEPADPYAEQRKWIGCVCRFWYDNPNDTLLDYLDKIQTGKNGVEYYAKESGDWFPHCEPILPTDDAIYKGGDNE